MSAFPGDAFATVSERMPKIAKGRGSRQGSQAVYARAPTAGGERVESPIAK